ncbi:MAG: hypothetical protein MMC33_007739 [Icmadophila ericetorum]|nr:hypothetical protein [Icmadophila ericetorum]
MAIPESRATRNRAPAYLASSPTSPLNSNLTLYSAIAAAPKSLVYSHILPIRSGHAWTVPAGSTCRITTPEGPQVGDLNLWNLHNPRERFWASRTRQLHRSHVTTLDRLWSCLPYLRPMVTIIEDSLGDYGVDEVGGRCHDLLGTRCDPYVNKMLTGDDFDYHCHSNLTRAILPYGLNESDVHDVLNVFQVTGLNKDGQYFMETSPAKPGDYFEFFAEIDILCALSTCPGGDLSAWEWGEGKEGVDVVDMVDCCRPLGIEVYQLTNTKVLDSWNPPMSPTYHGMHGLKLPTFQR